MTLVTLQRLAPVAPGASTCHLCDTPIVGSTQDDLLVGQPGTAEVGAVICTRCGDVLERLAASFGPELCLLVKGVQPAPAQPKKPPSELAATRHRLTQEADTLGRAAQTLRGEAEKLGHLDGTP
ncbi:MAG TPA: hypothetical protein VFG86_24840 [Chloroflexota bacterium]|jgi:hypothetical protein|nr:hypothetical protein [Chloroflexota bacterium]